MTTTPIQPHVTPAAGTYVLDPSHTWVSFSARHLMVSKVRGKFAVTGGTLTIADDPTQSAVTAIIDAGSIASGDEKRDEHLRSEDFFAVEQYPTITFRSTRVEDRGGGEFTLHGELTIKEVTRAVVLAGEYLGSAQAPWGTTSIGFTAQTEVNRRDWGLEWNVALDSGGVLVGEKVTLTIDAEWIAQ
ncbi:MAG: YceI family protein [Actinomycetota bacterium]